MALGLEWINSDEEIKEAAGWSALFIQVPLKPAGNLHIDGLPLDLSIVNFPD